MNAYEYQCFIDSSAREYTKSHGETTVIYKDTDMNPNGELCWCSETEWDRMLDNGQVETSWVEYCIFA